MVVLPGVGIKYLSIIILILYQNKNGLQKIIAVFFVIPHENSVFGVQGCVGTLYGSAPPHLPVRIHIFGGSMRAAPSFCICFLSFSRVFLTLGLIMLLITITPIYNSIHHIFNSSPFRHYINSKPSAFDCLFRNMSDCCYFCIT